MGGRRVVGPVPSESDRGCPWLPLSLSRMAVDGDGCSVKTKSLPSVDMGLVWGVVGFPTMASHVLT